ncbi:MAG: threonine synthase [Bacillota bacterium]
MRYISTRGGTDPVSPAEAIKQGPAPDGGLFVPTELPRLDPAQLTAAPYWDKAAAVLKLYLPDFSDTAITAAARAAYSTGRFDHEAVAPLHRLNDQLSVLELWHGPTCAFKDMALQILPHLLREAARKTGETAALVILTATSGDTGKAALEGFRDVPGTQVIVFYPAEGVSPIQAQQMVTQEGNNVHVVALRGNFDDAQAGVKALFTDRSLAGELAGRGYRFTSANSINWGRLIPQIVYYYAAYLELLREGAAGPGEKINFVVPSGNFGNILAGYYACRMGLPIHRLICASNRNNVLTDFLRGGFYNRNRPFYQTLSPSMDILVSSNLERLLFELAGREPGRVSRWMRQLRESGGYQVDPGTLQDLGTLFWPGFAGDAETLGAIARTFWEHGYLIDPHTAVGRAVYDQYRAETADPSNTVIISTASPFKFNASTARAVLEPRRTAGKTEYELLELLSQTTGSAIPASLNGLEQKPVLHSLIVNPAEIKSTVLRLLA